MYTYSMLCIAGICRGEDSDGGEDSPTDALCYTLLCFMRVTMRILTQAWAMRCYLGAVLEIVLQEVA